MHRRAPIWPFLLALASLVPLPASADEVWLANGRRLSGEVRVGAESVEIASASGRLTLPASLVARIERGPSLEQRIAAMRAALRPDDAEGLYRLARFAAAEGAATLARRLFEEVLALEPDHPGARRALGFRRHGDRWVTEEEHRGLRGEVRFRGAWRPAAEVDRLLAWEAAVAQVEAERQREAAWRAHQDAERARLEAELARQAALLGFPYGPFRPDSWAFVPGLVIIKPPRDRPDMPREALGPGRPPEVDRRPPAAAPARSARSSLLAVPQPGPRLPRAGSRPAGR